MKRWILITGAGEQLNGTVTGGQAYGLGQAGLHRLLQRGIVTSGKASQLDYAGVVGIGLGGERHCSLDKLMDLGGTHAHDTTNPFLAGNLELPSLWITGEVQFRTSRSQIRSKARPVRSKARPVLLVLAWSIAAGRSSLPSAWSHPGWRSYNDGIARGIARVNRRVGSSSRPFSSTTLRNAARLVARPATRLVSVAAPS